MPVKGRGLTHRQGRISAIAFQLVPRGRSPPIRNNVMPQPGWVADNLDLAGGYDGVLLLSSDR